jgi:hypothetical protein
MGRRLLIFGEGKKLEAENGDGRRPLQRQRLDVDTPYSNLLLGIYA